MISLNHEVIGKLWEIANLHIAQNSNPFRSQAYLNAVNTLDNLPIDVEKLLEDKGILGLNKKMA